MTIKESYNVAGSPTTWGDPELRDNVTETSALAVERLLARLHANKAALLNVIDRPEIPLHTNGSENDILCHVTRRKVSGGTPSDLASDQTSRRVRAKRKRPGNRGAPKF